MRFAIFLSLLTVNLIGCGTHLPPVTLCNLDNPAHILRCSYNGEYTTHVDLGSTKPNQYVCEPTADAQIIFNYIKDLEKKLAACGG